MAQLVFSSIGQAAGSTLLPNGVSILGQQISGAAIGQFVGSVAGAAVDSYLFAPRLEGPRVKDIHVTESREGASIPNVYGRMRVGGNVIWASRFKEKSKKDGGKGGPSQTSYDYSLSFAVGLCEGEVSRISRIWANGEVMDLSKVNWRLHKGSMEQQPDALIEAVEAAAPAFRGLAYIVFEDLPLDAYGMRMPQLSFEVMRSVKRDSDDIPRMEDAITSVNMIPGSGEFVYATDVVSRIIDEGEEAPENMHSGAEVSNFIASLEQALADMPNLSHVNLIVGWFGNDLRCGECMVRPGVEISEKQNAPLSWRVAGQYRGQAYLISQDSEGRANYGGTPDDISVMQAITALKARGLKVTLYPFLFMDVPPQNGLPDLYGNSEQSAFPWRGRITCSMGKDMSPQADVEVAAFFGQVLASDFGVNGYTGTEDWRYRRFILHYADLAKRAGGVDAFLIGAEMVGLTRVRSARGIYPAADEFVQLAAEVRTIVGDLCKLSYAADWTEYGAYSPADGLNDTDFPLDDLWASPDIDFIGVDWYPPMADWRDEHNHLDQQLGWNRLHDPAYLAANIEGGEAYDWYYANDADRIHQVRKPIEDGAYDEPWVYRQKDIRNWHEHAHYQRVSGVRANAPTAWVPSAKPVRFVEFGCSAVDKGPNQPNVFYDPKSSENALPHFSTGARDDVVQRHAIESFCEYWRDDPMLDTHGISVWAWDARPFPAWPARDDIWGDGANWTFGHWLNGRVGVALLKDVVVDLVDGYDIALNVDGLQGIVSGYGLDRAMSLRDGLEPLKLAFGIQCIERDGVLFFENTRTPVFTINTDEIVLSDTGVGSSISRQSMEVYDPSIRLQFIDAANDYQAGLVTRGEREGRALRDISLPLVMDASQAGVQADGLVQLARDANETGYVVLSLGGLAIECGDRLALNGHGGDWRVEKVSQSEVQVLNLVRDDGIKTVFNSGVMPVSDRMTAYSVKPHVVIVDGPVLPNEEDDARPFVFAFAQPWSGPVSVKMGATESLLRERAVIESPSVMGRLMSDLSESENGRWMAQSIDVRVYKGALESASQLAVLNGANAVFVETVVGWELLQYQQAELIGAGIYRLSRFLRGQQGSDSAARVGAEIGAQVIFLNGEEKRLDIKNQEMGLDLRWHAGVEGVSPDKLQIGEFVWEANALKRWSPCHLIAELVAEGLEIKWTSRTRVGGDLWGNAEYILEGSERCKVHITGGNNIERIWQTDMPATLYQTAQIQADFSTGDELKIEVSQLGFDAVTGHVQTIYVVI